MLVDKRMTRARGQVQALPDNHAMIIDGVSDAVGERIQRAEICHSGCLAPIKRNGIERRILVAGRIAKSYDLAFAVHAVWCVPCFSAQIAHVDGSAVLVLPEHSVN